MTDPSTLFEKQGGLTILEDRFFASAKQNAPGLLARFIAQNHKRYRRWRFQDWRPLPLNGSPSEAWFPVVINDGLGFDGRGAIPGQLVRVGLHLDEELSVQVPMRHVDAAKAWVRRIVGDERAALPMEGQLDIRMSMTSNVSTHDFSSCELACACALVSHLTQRTPRSAMIASGKLSGTVNPGEVLPIGKASQKRDIVMTEARASQQTVEPLIASGVCAPNDVLSWMEQFMGPGLQEALQDACLRSAEGMIFQSVKLYDSDPRTAVALAQAAKDQLEGTDKAVALWIVGADLMHRGQSMAALAHIEEATACWNDQHANRYPRTYLRPWLESLSGIALVDNGRVSDAVTQLSRIYSALQASKTDSHEWRITATRVVGSLRRAMQADGQLDAAIEMYQEWVADVPHQERSRCLGDLAVMHWAADQADDGYKCLADARRWLPHCTDEERLMNRRYLELFGMRMGGQGPQDAAPWQCTSRAGAVQLRAVDFSEAALWHAHQVSVEPFVDEYEQYCEAAGVRSIAAGWVVLRAIAEHLLRQNRATPMSDRLKTFVLQEQARLEPDQAASMVRALTCLAKGDPTPWLRVAPY